MAPERFAGDLALCRAGALGHPNDTGNHCYRLSRLLPAGMVFPYNFGSVPATAAEDGDPLDLLILTDIPLFVGCLVQTRLLGVLIAEQSEGGKTIRNDRLIGVAVTEANPALYDTLEDLPPVRLAEIEHFFVSYNRAHGREFKPLRLGDQRTAERAVRAARSRYRRAREVKVRK